MTKPRRNFADAFKREAGGAVGSKRGARMQIVVFPRFGPQASFADNLAFFADNLAASAIFTGVSIARSYAPRRLFEAIPMHSASEDPCRVGRDALSKIQLVFDASVSGCCYALRVAGTSPEKTLKLSRAVACCLARHLLM